MDDWMKAYTHGKTVYSRRRGVKGAQLNRESKQLVWDCGRFTKNSANKNPKSNKTSFTEPQYGVLVKGEFLQFPDFRDQVGKMLVCNLCPNQLHCFENGWALEIAAPLSEMPVEAD